MLLTCPTCGYDLAGLDQSRGAVCPECGSCIGESGLVVAWRRACSRAWLMFFLSPVFALPGALVYGLGQPVLSFALSLLFAYRALNRMDGLLGLRDQRALNTLASLLLAFSCTFFSSFVLLLIAATVFGLVGRF